MLVCYFLTTDIFEKWDFCDFYELSLNKLGVLIYIYILCLEEKA